MDNTLKMGKDSATGSFHLFIARMVSTVILAVSAIVVGLLIEDAAYGLYVVALVPVTTLLLFQDWGVGAALTKYCARYRSSGDEGNLRRLIVSGMTFEVTTGLTLTLLSFLMVNLIASAFLGEPESAFLITLGSIAILFTGIFTGSQAIFVGFDRMKLVGLTLIAQATVYCVLSPLLVYLGYGALGIMIGYTFSYMTAGIISALFLYFFIFRHLSYCRITRFEILQTLKLLLRFGVPLASAIFVAGILTQFYSFTMAYYCDFAIIGHYKVATNFAVLVTFFTIPISTVLFPAFSKLDSEDNQETLKLVFSSSVKYSTLFALPATVVLMVLSAPLISTLYGDKWFYSPFFLSLYLIQFLFVGLGAMSKSSLLQGMGQTKMLLKLHIITLSIGIPLALLLIPAFEIVGLILASLFAQLPSIFIGLHWIWKRFGVKVDFNSSARITLAVMISGLITYFFTNNCTAAPWITLTTGVAVFLTSYVISVPLVGAVRQTDIDNLRTMFSGLGVASRLLEIPLKIIEKQLKIKGKLSEIGHKRASSSVTRLNKPREKAS
jgi:O-antigen/teichoic acid export membrane protein